MARIYFVLAALAALVAVVSTAATPESISMQVITDPNKFLPAGEYGEQFIQTTNNSRATGPFKFTIGQRKSGDILLATQTRQLPYSPQQDVQITLTYPASGKGLTVNYMEIFLNQDATARVTSGGVGQRHISVQLFIPRTVFVDYTANVYGAGSRIIVNQVLFIGLVASLIFKYGSDSSLFGLF